MALWVDKHRPQQLSKLDFGLEQAAGLQRLAASSDLPHLLFYGPSGAGKRTRVMALLREVFGPGVEKVRLDHRPFKVPSGRVVDVTTVSSSYHIEINPGDAGIYDRYVVQELIKEMAQYNPVEAARPWKVLLLSEVDRLSREAQAALRRTMEKYTGTCRLVLIATSPSKVIEPVRSRCLGVRVPAPTQPDMMKVLTAVGSKEGMVVPPQLAAKVSASASRNLRRALLMLEAMRVSAGAAPVPATAPVPAMDWERFIGLVVADIAREQSPRSLLAVRTRLYELLVNCIPADVILRRTVAGLVVLPGMPDPVKHELCHWAAHYEHRLQLGSKEIFHLEAFVAKAMYTIKVGPGPQPVPAGAGAAAAGGAGAP